MNNDLNKIVIGVFGHVDAGKTTLAENLLYKTGTIRKLGRVDHKDAFLDYNQIEKERGITIFNKEARFNYKDREYIYIDTPGHNDFKEESKRALKILDAAILIISAIDQNIDDTKKIYERLLTYNIPIIIFINKMDISYKNEEEILLDLKNNLSQNVINVNQIKELLNEGLIDNIYDSLINHEILPLIYGSALKDNNIDLLLDTLNDYLKPKEYNNILNAYIYRISNINKERFVYIKIMSGTLKNKTVFNENNKINEIYLINGNDYKLIQEAKQNDVVAVKGIKDFKVGTFLPSLINDLDIEDKYTNILLVSGNKYNIYNQIKVLNDEMPSLNIHLIEDDLFININGLLEKEIVLKTFKERFNLDVELGIKEITEEVIEEEEIEEVKDNHYTYSRMNVSDEEVNRVFNNTFNPKQRVLPNNKKEVKEETTYIKQKEIIYLIDGYNLMHYDDELDDISKTNFIDARNKLINIVCDYAAYINGECILVFDAYKNYTHNPSISKYDNITIVYTRTKQSADQYIQEKTKELVKDYKVIVVSSDALEQQQIFSDGGFRMSSREFYLRYDSLKKYNKHIENKPNKPLSELRKILFEDGNNS